MGFVINRKGIPLLFVSKEGVIMEACQFCQGKIPLHDEGIFKVSFSKDIKLKRIKSKLNGSGIALISKENTIQFTYSSWEKLRSSIAIIKSELTDVELDQSKGNFICWDNVDMVHTEEIPLFQLAYRINNPSFVKVIQEHLFQSFMQPIISCESDQVYGYEFLLRPNSQLYHFSPGDLFHFSQLSGLQSMLDSQSRINAIRTGSQMLSRGTKQFINFLPSSIYNPSHCLKSTFKAVEEYGADPDDLIFEVVETERITDMSHLKEVFKQYKKSGMKVALDDIGAGYSTIDVLTELKPDYAKLDRELIRNCHNDSRKMETIYRFRKLTSELGITLLAEGIETQKEYEEIKPYVDLVQGYYFGKPLKTPI